MELRDIIKEYKNRYHVSNKELAQRFQVTHITIGRWLRGEVKTIQEETAQNMSQVLGYDVQALLKGTATDLKKPVLGTAKAGYDMYYDQNYLGEESVSLQEYHEGDYFLKVHGDSMIHAGIKDGGLVYVKQCNDVLQGEVAVVSIGNEEVTIKAVYKNNEKMILRAANDAYVDREFSLQEASLLPVEIIGKVVFAKHYF